MAWQDFLNHLNSMVPANSFFSFIKGVKPEVFKIFAIELPCK